MSSCQLHGPELGSMPDIAREAVAHKSQVARPCTEDVRAAVSCMAPTESGSCQLHGPDLVTMLSTWPTEHGQLSVAWSRVSEHAYHMAKRTWAVVLRSILARLRWLDLALVSL